MKCPSKNWIFMLVNHIDVRKQKSYGYPGFVQIIYSIYLVSTLDICSCHMYWLSTISRVNIPLSYIYLPISYGVHDSKSGRGACRSLSWKSICHGSWSSWLVVVVAKGSMEFLPEKKSKKYIKKIWNIRKYQNLWIFFFLFF